MKEYKKIVKKLSPFFEAHHMDLHEQFDIVLAKLARIEAKLDKIDAAEGKFFIVDEVELDPANIKRPLDDIVFGQESPPPKESTVTIGREPAEVDRPLTDYAILIDNHGEDPCIDEECEDEIADLYKEGGVE